jgi:hypothetical protein
VLDIDKKRKEMDIRRKMFENKLGEDREMVDQSNHFMDSR